jgi:diadenosine tetraphosphate (Ap4A) HIT family hydrolase
MFHYLNMNCFSCNKMNSKEGLFYENDSWKVKLINDQGYIGHSVVILKRHCESISEINKKEWLDLLDLIKIIENLFKKVFSAELCNWNCMLNFAYRDNEKAHVHWHVLARTRKKFVFENEEFFEPNFGEHYDINHKKIISDELKEKIVSLLKNNL